MADWRADVLKGLGAPLTKQNLDFMASWQRWEGGHTNNAARWNWLNTTSNAPGAVRSINSVGVKAFDSYADGVNATIQTLNNGNYPDIVEALRKGDPYTVKPTRGLGTWVAGPGAANSEHARAYASRVLGTKVSAPIPAEAKPPKGRGPGNAKTQPGGQTWGGGGNPAAILQRSEADSMYQRALAGFMLGRAAARLGGQTPTGGLLQLVQLRDEYQAMGGVPDAPEARTTAHSTIQKVAQSKVKGGRLLSAVVGGKVQTGTDFWGDNHRLLIPAIEPGRGTHVTDNLDWNHGQRTARDIMARPGTVVGAPESGTVVRHGSAQGGESLYFKGDDGRMMWLGHIDNILPVGTRVKKGAPIARISRDHPRPHLHFDYKL